MNSNSNICKLLFAFFFLTAVFTACTKIESTSIGGSLIPSIDGVNTKDTFLNVQTDLLLDKDSTVVPSSYIHSLGYISNDPLFGRIQANINFQVYPNFFPFIFDVVKKDSLHLDSVVLVMSYQGVWGDTNSNLNLKVYEISQSQKFKDTTMHSAETFSYTNLLGTKNNVDPKKLDDSVFAKFDTSKNQLRIKLDNSFGDRLLKTYDSTNAYKNDTVFNTYVNGLGVVADPTGNALLQISLTDPNTKLAIYYRVDNRAGGKDTTVKYFKLSTFSSTSNYIKRDRLGAEIAPFLASSATNDSLLHVQTAPGTYVTIKIPGLGTFPNATIHRAELVMQQVRHSNLDDVLTPPVLFLSAYKQDSTFARFLVPFANSYSSGSIENLGEFGAYPFKKTDANNNLIYAYNFDITRYAQRTVTTKSTNYNLVLFAPHTAFMRFNEDLQSGGLILPSSQFNPPAVGRVRLGGGTHSKQPMKLRIIYSPLK
jgi:hypothetical protein